MADGRLIQPFEDAMDEGTGYWLAYPEARRNVPKMKKYRGRIVGDAEAARRAGFA